MLKRESNMTELDVKIVTLEPMRIASVYGFGDSPEIEAMDKLFANELGRVLVMEEDQVVGIITRTDILNYIRIHNRLD